MNTTTGLLIGNIRLSQITLKTELFKKRFINRDLVLLNTACFNHMFNYKKWFIEYEDVEPLSTSTSNKGTKTVIGHGTVRLMLVLLKGRTYVLELPNAMY